jgi:AraC-like DNA-binding protein
MQPLAVDNLPAQGAGYHIKVYEKDGFHLPWHMHDSYELTLIQRGSGQRIVGSHIEAFGPGDMVLLGPGLPHVWKNSRREQQSRVRAITLKLATQHPLLRLLELPEMEPLQQILQASMQGLLIMDTLRDTLAAQLEALSNQPVYRQLNGIIDILASISESCETRTLLPREASDYLPRESVSTRKVIDHIFDHYPQALDAASLAEVAGVHPASLGRLFKRTTGFTTTEFINQVRINRACQLLHKTDMPVLEISLHCGYENLSWFNRVFKQLRDCTPRAYRTRLNAAQK